MNIMLVIWIDFINTSFWPRTRWCGSRFSNLKRYFAVSLISYLLNQITHIDGGFRYSAFPMMAKFKILVDAFDSSSFCVWTHNTRRTPISFSSRCSRGHYYRDHRKDICSIKCTAFIHQCHRVLPSKKQFDVSHWCRELGQDFVTSTAYGRCNNVRSLGTLLHSTKQNISFDGHTSAKAAIKKEVSNAIETLQPYFDFPLDEWQLEAGGHVMAERNVIVCGK